MSRDYHIVDTYIDGVGTIRDYLDCGQPVIGGPVRCKRCAEQKNIGPIRRWIIRNIFGLWIPLRRQ